jgi:enediyne biosynthesis protein E4
MVVTLWWCARLPRLSKEETSDLAKHFRFERKSFPKLSVATRSYRSVNPRLHGLAAWISSVGASIALGDLDGDGLPNDACLVDPRTDQVIVTPVPGTGLRFQPFALDPHPLTFDSPTMAPMGCIMADLNEDGLRDLVVYYWGRTPIAFLRRQTKATMPLTAASFAPQELVPGGERWYTNAGLTADLDGDGHADLLFGNYFADGSVLLGAAGRVEMPASMSHAENGGSKPVLLWKSASSGESPTVNYEVVTMNSTFGNGWTLAMAACDIDGDLLPEIYIANDFGPDRLLQNLSTPGHLRFRPLRGHREWTTPKSKVLGQDSYKGMGVDCADLNGDGIPDFMVSNISDTYALEEANLVFLSTGNTNAMLSGSAPYRERAEILGLARSGWSWDVRFGDFDNSGTPQILQANGFVRGTVNRWPELHELALANDVMVRDPVHWPQFIPGADISGENHNRFFVRATSGRYFDLAREIGLGDPEVTRGIATADVDGDGRLDFAVANQWGDSFLFRNTSTAAGEFLGLHLLVPVHPEPTSIRDSFPSNATPGYPAIGARVTVHLPDGRNLVQQVDGGNGHSGKSSPDLHFGLGSIGHRELPVSFVWRNRNGTIQHYEAMLGPGWHTVFLGTTSHDHR